MLLDGLTNGAKMFDLKAVLNSLPPDLEDLFWRMLGGSDLKSASELIQLVWLVPQPYLIELSFANEDEEHITNHPSGILCSAELEARAEIMRRRVNHVCNGLLEISLKDSLSNRKLDIFIER